MNSWEFYSRIEMFKHTQKDDELAHYGIAGQKWGKRRWQYADGRFNPEGKERYFGTKNSSSSDDKMGGARSNVKDYLKFRNKMLKKHAKADMDKWYIEEHKEDDKKLLKDAKRIDKSAKKMYENQLKDYYDNPNDLVDDLNKVYKFGGKASKKDPEAELYKEIEALGPNATLSDVEKLLKSSKNAKQMREDWDKEYPEMAEYEAEKGGWANQNQKFGSSEYDPDSQMKHFKMWNDVGKKVKTDGGNVRAIFESDEDLYDDNAQALILKNADKIHDMDKALQKGNDSKYFKVRNSFDNDYEKDLAEIFVGDKRSLDDYNDLIKDANKKLSKRRIDVQDYDESEDMWPSNIMKNTKQKEKIKETVNDLNDNYEKHNEIILNKLADMYYNAYKNTYGYEENPLTKSEFKQSFSNVTGTLLPSGKLEGYVESHEYGDDSFGTDYYFMYDILNKTLSNVEND